MAETTPPIENDQQAQRQSGQLGIQKVYAKDISFEAPNTPQVFTEEWKPQAEIQLASRATSLGGDVHEVVLTVTVTVRFEQRTVYLIEVHQAGIFNIVGFPPEVLQAVLGTVCPNILFPFAREAVSDLATRGGFPQLLLSPVNFEALYAQEIARQRQVAEGSEAATH